MGQQQAALISIVGEEVGSLCALSLVVIEAKFSNWQEPLPVILLIVAVCLQVLLQGCNDTFGLSVGLRLKSCAEISRYAESSCDPFPKSRGEK